MQSVDRPTFLIVAGPNGSGKSSAYEQSDVEEVGRSVWIINPDLLAARIRDVEHQELAAANLLAVQRIESWLETSIEAYQTIGVETVLSTEKYRRLVVAAQQRNYEIGLIYVMLDDPHRNIERVQIRVTKGGHAVPKEKIIERYFRSLKQMPWFLQQADRAWLYDNSGARPKLVGEKSDGVVTLDPRAPKRLVEAVRSIESTSD